uniref:G_PROTEIN_RECEP_F1_2 domain-containing protein n=1 Tax=Heterorhabditis bacteriophora TaxID=37862 RepID=A0A1I7W896_HETBA
MRFLMRQRKKLRTLRLMLSETKSTSFQKSDHIYNTYLCNKLFVILFTNVVKSTNTFSRTRSFKVVQFLNKRTQKHFRYAILILVIYMLNDVTTLQCNTIMNTWNFSSRKKCLLYIPL